VKIPKENIKRFKEAALLLSFLFLLFSFSGRSVVHTKNSKQTKQTWSVQKDKLISSVSHFKLKAPQINNPDPQVASSTKITLCENKKFTARFSKNYSHVNRRITSRLYYHLFSQKADELPSLT
jgi:hypothetical protein